KKPSSCSEARLHLIPKAQRRTTTWHAFSPIRVTTMAPFASCNPQSNCGQISVTPRHSSACCFNDKETPSQRLLHFVTWSKRSLRVPMRSEERRVGKQCRAQGSRRHAKKEKIRSDEA